MAVLELRPPRIEYPIDGSVCPVTRFVWYPQETGPLAPGAADKLAGKRVVIIGGTDPTVYRIIKTLEERGAAVFRYNQNGANTDKAVAEFKRRVGAVDGIIDLNVGESFSLAEADTWESPLKQSVALIKAFYEEWVAETDAMRLFYMAVTALGGTMGYTGNGIVQPLGGIWAGLAKSLPREIPNCNVKVLDLSPEDYMDVDQIIADELYNWGLFEVGYRNGVRYTLAAHKEAVSRPTISLTSADTVLMSGGARGIGFALAKALTKNFGCRVIVTGRHPLPEGTEPWVSMDEIAFKNYQQNLLKALPHDKTVAQIRYQIEHFKRQRELFRHMQEAAQEELRLEYRACDFNSLDEVAKLIEAIGPELSGVIHNAGVDTPVRLRGKSIESFIATVRVKVKGFLNIIQALDRKQLKFLCNVGSLTGRMGGMIGQMDYGAANEGLARLGLWAAYERQLPVKTLCWPTWERLGMIANFEATLKYMSAVNVEEGVYHWQRDLLAGGLGEVTFVGKFGKAVSPVQLMGYPPISAMPQIERLLSQCLYLGEVLNFSPFRYIRSRNRIDVRAAPCMHDFTVGNNPALPVSVLLEYALSVSDWVVPEGWSELNLQEIRDIEINLPALKAGDACFEFEKEATGSWVDDTWVVNVELTKVASGGREILGRLQLVYGKETPRGETLLPLKSNNWHGQIFRPALECSWGDLIYEPARWSKQPDGTFIGEVKPCQDADLWTMPFVPTSVLPASHLENIFRASMALNQNRMSMPWLVVSKIELYSTTTSWSAILARVTENKWYVIDREGHAGLCVEGIEYQTAQAKQEASLNFDHLLSVEPKALRMPLQSGV